MITRLAFYDMDGTLMDTPMPDVGKKKWKEVTGDKYPHQGWWGRAESLNTKVFNIKPFPAVLSQLKNDTTRPDTLTVLLTNRVEKLKPAVLKLLDSHQIAFDDYSLKKGGQDKADRIKHFLSKYPTATEISVFDDRKKELDVLSKLKSDIGDDVTVNIYKADEGKLSLAESYNRIQSIINEEMARHMLKEYSK